MMKNLLCACLVVCFPLTVSAMTFDDMLLHETSTSRPFLGYQYGHIRWTEHTPDESAESYKEEAGSGGQTDVGVVDLDKDGKEETLKAIWGPGVSDHYLRLEVLQDGKKIGEMATPGIQSNFKVHDFDGDGKLEVAIWGAVPDEDMSQDADDENYEGHSDLHKFRVQIYRLESGEYKLWKEYVSRKKYEPFCEEMPVE